MRKAARDANMNNTQSSWAQYRKPVWSSLIVAICIAGIALEWTVNGVQLQYRIADRLACSGWKLHLLDRCETLARNDPDLLYGVARLRLCVAVNEAYKAAQAASKSLAIRPDEPDVLLLRGQANFIGGRYPQSQYDLDRALALWRSGKTENWSITKDEIVKWLDRADALVASGAASNQSPVVICPETNKCPRPN
jgi:hypothetical protein